MLLALGVQKKSRGAVIVIRFIVYPSRDMLSLNEIESFCYEQ